MKTKKRFRKPRIVRLVGLPRTRKVVRAMGVINQREAIYWLRQGIAVTASGDNGALNMWVDKFGQFCAEFHSYQVTLSSEQFDRITPTKAWLKSWWPRLGRS
jgi:hypothetical protein